MTGAHQRLLAAASGSGSGSAAETMPLWLSACPTRWPSDGGTILHIFERVHFVLFVTSFFYFGSLAVIYTLFVRRMRAYAKIERELHEAQKTKSAADVEGSGGTSTAEVDVTIKTTTSTPKQEYHLLALRAFVMSHCPTGVDAGGRVLSVRAFLQRTCAADIDELIAFPVSTWAIVGVGALIMATTTTYYCDLSMTHMLDAIWNWLIVSWLYFSALYCSVRMVLWRRAIYKHYEATKKGTATVKPDPFAAWRCPQFDRATCLLHAGVTGFLPHQALPNEKWAMVCIQTVLWYQWYFLIYTIMDPVTYKIYDTYHGWFAGADAEVQHLTDYYSTMLGVEVPPFNADRWLQVHLVNTIVTNVLNAISIITWILLVPKLLEMYALPPYLSDEETSHIKETLETFPEGHCPETAPVHEHVGTTSSTAHHAGEKDH